VRTRHCGMAATLTDNHVHGNSQVRDVGCLHGKSAREMAEYARSDNPPEASIGVAAINSLLDVDESKAVEINAVEMLIEHGRDKNLVVKQCKMEDKQGQKFKSKNGKRATNTWVMVLTLIGVGAAPCPECGMPFAIHLWPLALLLAVTRFLADRARSRSTGKTTPEKQLAPDVERELP